MVGTSNQSVPEMAIDFTSIDDAPIETPIFVKGNSPLCWIIVPARDLRLGNCLSGDHTYVHTFRQTDRHTYIHSDTHPYIYI